MRAIVAAVLALLVATAVASSFLFVEPKLDRAVKQALQKNEKTIPVYVRFPSLDLSVYEAIENVEERARFLVNDLQVHAELTQASIVAKLRNEKIEHKTLWIANGLAIKNCPVELVNWLAMHPNVELVTLDEEVQMIFEKATQVGAEPTQDDYEWSLEWIQGTKVWADGHEGEGVVVGVIDTGASYTHEAIGDRYRGKKSDGTFDHDYNWFQTIGPKSPTPIDDHSHGTHCTGTILGKSKTHTYGMAPKAQFMSCKAFTSGGSGSKSSIMGCLQFMLAPTTVDGQEPDTSKRPHVISNSYTCGSCLGDGKKAVDALVAAGVSVVAAAGNGGPGCSSISAEPGILDAVISVGALEVKKDNVTSFSSRGPIRADGSNRIKPDVTAPGRDILSSTPGNNYGRMSGTSMACPHVAGSVALLWSAVPGLMRKPKESQEVIRKYAKHIDVSGTYCNSKGIPNNMYGWGTTQIHDSINGAKKLLRK